MEALRWARDWAVFGGITCAVAPSVANSGVYPLIPPEFPPTAAWIGLVSGAGVGLLLWAALGCFPAARRVSIAAVLVPPALGGWGAAVAAAAAWLAAPGMQDLAVVCGSVAALVQSAWFAPLYTRQARRRGWRWPLLVVAAGTAWLAGFAAVTTVLGVRF